MQRIYVVDDEFDIGEIVKVNLESEGYQVLAFLSALEALSNLEKQRPDLIILDIMMPEMDGYEFCRRIKSDERFSDIPVIYLSAKSDEFDKVLGLELGGDDYITKPFGVKELKSRVKAVLRRSSSDKAEPLKRIVYKGLELFPESFRLKVDGEDVRLTKTEFKMLELFLTHREKIFSRNNIIDSVRGEDVYVVDRTIDVHIMNLRKKLAGYKNVITTFSGVGYGFKE